MVTCIINNLIGGVIMCDHKPDLKEIQDQRLIAEYDLLNPDDIEMVLYGKFKLWRDLTPIEIKFTESIMNHLKNAFGNLTLDFWHMCYDLVYCPFCKKDGAVYFHGHKVTEGKDHPNIFFHQDVFYLFCKSCDTKLKEHESMSFNHIEQRIKFMPNTNIPIYSGLFVKNLSQE